MIADGHGELSFAGAVGVGAVGVGLVVDDDGVVAVVAVVVRTQRVLLVDRILAQERRTVD